MLLQNNDNFDYFLKQNDNLIIQHIGILKFSQQFVDVEHRSNTTT